jgi:DNA-binding MarR family transcriptional regulator
MPNTNRNTEPSSTARAVARLLEHATRALNARSYSEGLNPAQWNALRYMADANESARTVTAFASHHLTSKAAASDTLKALVEKKLLKKHGDPDDARIQIFSPTAAGSHMLQRDPLRPLEIALSRQPQAELLEFATTLAQTIRHLYPEQGSDRS